MPGTASSKLQSRAHAKARPSANARAANLVANTPVLFRLPLIPHVPTQELAATFAGSATGLPTAQLAAIASAVVAGTAASSASTAAVTNTSTANTHADPSAHTAPARSWWEHWSSGIVLIVLLIALATASILAWQGGSKPNEKLLADTAKPSDSLSDLSAIEVPKLDNPKLDNPKLDNPKLDVPTLELPALKPASRTQANSQNNTLQPSNTNEDGSEYTGEVTSSLIPSGSTGLSFEAPSDSDHSAETPAGMLSPESHATASLQSPIIKPQEPLFKDEPTTARATISAQPASTPSSMNSNSTGGSPAIWDNSSLNPHATSTDSNQGLSLELSSPSTTDSTSNTFDTAAKPTTATSTPALLTSQLTTTPTSTTAPSTMTTGTVVPSNLQYAGMTTTPELDHAALIATYRQYSSAGINAPAIDTRVNLYKTTAPTTSTLGPQSPAGTSASMVGFTQQPTQQQTQQQTNYTLQSPLQNQTLQNQYQQPNQYLQPQYPNQYQQGQYQPNQYPSAQTQQMPSGTQAPASQQYVAPNTGLINTSPNVSSGNGYYIPPTAPTNTQPTTLNYPSLN